MSTNDIHHDLDPQPKKMNISRITLLLGCITTIVLFSAFTLALAGIRPRTPSDHSITHTSGTTAKAPSKSITPTAPVATNPLPITPFPSDLQQERALLEAHDRFLFRGNTKLPEVALTFDDGPNPPYTSQILSILQHYGIKATFFCVGSQVQAFPTLVKDEFDDGNLVENHTWTHPYMPALAVPSMTWQITTTSDAIERVTGVRPTFLRPPYGAFNAPVLADINQFGLSTVIWDVDTLDWSRPGVDTIVKNMQTEVENGSIILMHDGGGNRSQTVAALPIVIEWLQQHGYSFVTLQQLVDDFHKNAPTSPTNRTNVAHSSLQIWKRRSVMLYSQMVQQ